MTGVWLHPQLYDKPTPPLVFFYLSPPLLHYQKSFTSSPPFIYAGLAYFTPSPLLHSVLHNTYLQSEDNHNQKKKIGDLQKSKAYFLKSKPYFFESKPSFLKSTGTKNGHFCYIYLQIKNY